MEFSEAQTCSILNISRESAAVKFTEQIIYCHSAHNFSLSEEIAKFTITGVT